MTENFSSRSLLGTTPDQEVNQASTFSSAPESSCLVQTAPTVCLPDGQEAATAAAATGLPSFWLDRRNHGSVRGEQLERSRHTEPRFHSPVTRWLAIIITIHLPPQGQRSRRRSRAGRAESFCSAQWGKCLTWASMASSLVLFPSSDKKI